jgi:hypothetical protein
LTLTAVAIRLVWSGITSLEVTGDFLAH